jgi:hypothetical protein
LRLCYAGSRDDMHEAVTRIGNWLGNKLGGARGEQV